MANREHRRSKRQYAHVFHYPGNVICVARAFDDLPIKIRQGLIAHEIGHLLLKTDQAHTESDANKAVARQFGLEVGYRNSPYGERLEYLKAGEFL